ncbi:MAG TPA: agmatinase family protein [Planctomycetes bacterium]|nr:agmatinase family protein [Planctomycetota bacterium]HIL50938.1 agmatinase family protein [Planctomycetota bacterium]
MAGAARAGSRSVILTDPRRADCVCSCRLVQASNSKPSKQPAPRASMTAFDPDDAATPESGVFGLNDSSSEAGVRLLGAPFDATTSYRQGAARAPQAILKASHQVDLFDALMASWPGSEGRPWQAGIALEIDAYIANLNAEAAPLARSLMASDQQADSPQKRAGLLARVNEIGGEVNGRVRCWTAEALVKGAVVGIVGGDHSVPFGAFEAASAHHGAIGILHFDAHADLRPAYGGLRWSHASIFANVRERLPQVEAVLSVGLRDLGQKEARTIAESGGRLRAIHSHEWAAWRQSRADLKALVLEHIQSLPEKIWISFDIDGLDPSLCPSTGTPVPGGLTWDEASLWLTVLAESQKEIVGFDLCEVSPGQSDGPEEDSWDAMVGARLLYRLIGLALARRARP